RSGWGGEVHLRGEKGEGVGGRLERKGRQGLSARARPHQRPMDMGRWQSRCDRAHHHRRRPAAKEVWPSNAAYGRRPADPVRAFGRCRLRLGAGSSQRRLTLVAHPLGGKTGPIAAIRDKPRAGGSIDSAWQGETAMLRKNILDVVSASDSLAADHDVVATRRTLLLAALAAGLPLAASSGAAKASRLNPDETIVTRPDAIRFV